MQHAVFSINQLIVNHLVPTRRCHLSLAFESPPLPFASLGPLGDLGHSDMYA
jgi:hypothetical protein